jgi:hypothetical protein
MRTAFVFVLSFVVLPVGTLRAANPPEETAAIAKIEALGGEFERKNDRSTLVGRLGSLLDSLRQKTADNPIVSVSFIGNDTLKDDDLQCLQP